MRAAETRDPPMSLDGFLAFLEDRPKGERWELDDGVPLMNPQPTRRHDWIQTNILEALRQHWRLHASPWRPSGPSQVPVPGAARTVAPDILVAPMTAATTSASRPRPWSCSRFCHPAIGHGAGVEARGLRCRPSIESVVLVRQDRRSVDGASPKSGRRLSAIVCTDESICRRSASRWPRDDLRRHAALMTASVLTSEPFASHPSSPSSVTRTPAPPPPRSPAR